MIRTSDGLGQVQDHADVEARYQAISARAIEADQTADPAKNVLIRRAYASATRAYGRYKNGELSKENALKDLSAAEDLLNDAIAGRGLSIDWTVLVVSVTTGLVAWFLMAKR